MIRFLRPKKILRPLAVFTIGLICGIFAPMILPQLRCKEIKAAQTPADNLDKTQWIEKCIKDFQSIKVDMTRREVEAKFHHDGGFYSKACMRFLDPDCNFIKVDVYFDFRRNPNDQNRAVFSDDDKVTKVGPPYLEYPCCD